MTRITLKDGTYVEIEPKSIASGAEAEIFASTDGRWMAKKYVKTDPIDVEQRKRTLDYCEQHNPYRVNADYWASRLAWPHAQVKAPWFGMIMPRIPGKMKSMAHYVLKLPYQILKKQNPEMLGDWGDRVFIATELARITWEAFGAPGLCHADFSSNNVLINERERRCALVDCDGIVIDGRTESEVAGTKGYAAPEVWSGQQAADVLSDRYSMAVLLYEFLLFRHPLEGRRPDMAQDAQTAELLKYGKKALYSEDRHNGENAVEEKPNQGKVFRSIILGREIADLFHIVFSEALHTNRMMRPTADRWREALEHLNAALVPCPNPQCRYKHFSVFGALEIRKNQLACPWCGTPLRNVSHVPVLHVYEQGSGGYFAPTKYHHLIGWPQRAIGLWQIDPERPLGATFPQKEIAPVAEFGSTRGKGMIINRRLPGITTITPDGGLTRIAPGESAEIRHEATVVFHYVNKQGQVADRLARSYLIPTQGG